MIDTQTYTAWATTVANLHRFFKLLEETMQIRESTTAVTPNILNLEGRPRKLKLLRNPTFSKIRQFEDYQINLMQLFSASFLNNGKNSIVNVFAKEVRNDKHQIRKISY